MRRTISETCLLNSTNVSPQKSVRRELVPDAINSVERGVDTPPPPPRLNVDADSWELTALPVKTVFSMRDIVQKVLAPLLDLQTLFNLSRVNRRLRTLLHEDKTLEEAKGYTGTMADYPDFVVVKHMSNLRVTAWMARRWKATYPLVVDYNGGVYSVEQDTVHFMQHLIGPLLNRSKLPDEELSRHMEVICTAVFPEEEEELSNVHRYKRDRPVSYLDHMIEDIARLACIRIRSPKTAMMLISAFVRSASPENTRVMWNRALLISQVSGNANLSCAIVEAHGPLHPAVNHQEMMLLLACASGKPDFFESEYIRCGKCVSIPELILFAKICNQNGMVRYILDVHCTCSDIEKVVQFVEFIPTPTVMILILTGKLTNTAVFSSQNYEVGLEPDDHVKFERHVTKLQTMFMDAHIRKAGGNQEDPAERMKVSHLFKKLVRNRQRH